AGTVVPLIGIGGGPVCLTAPSVRDALPIYQPITAGANNVLLVADNITLAANVSTAAGRAVTLAPFTGTRAITLDAAKVATSLSLTQADLNFVRSPILQLGLPTGVTAPLAAT